MMMGTGVCQVENNILYLQVDVSGRVGVTASDAARAQMDKRRKEIVTIALLPAGAHCTCVYHGLGAIPIAILLVTVLCLHVLIVVRGV
jgi:hypothetical protein